MLSALVDAVRVLDDQRYREAARRLRDFSLPDYGMAGACSARVDTAANWAARRWRIMFMWRADCMTGRN